MNTWINTNFGPGGDETLSTVNLSDCMSIADTLDNYQDVSMTTNRPPQSETDSTYTSYTFVPEHKVVSLIKRFNEGGSLVFFHLDYNISLI